MHLVEDYQKSFQLYFKLFKEMAEPEFVAYGGYDTGLPNGTASSLESLIYFANQVKDPNALVINAGAGASSFILRQIFKNIICVDLDKRYVDTVSKICRSQGIFAENFIVGIENIPECDYMYYDYGEFAIRMPNLHFALSKTKYALYADDGDDRENGAPSYRVMLHKVPEKFKDISSKDCKEAIDQYGRWGILLERKL